MPTYYFRFLFSFSLFVSTSRERLLIPLLHMMVDDDGTKRSKWIEFYHQEMDLFYFVAGWSVTIININVHLRRSPVFLVVKKIQQLNKHYKFLFRI